MATGILGTADLSAAANTTVYTVPANFSSHLENFFVSNNHTGNVTLSLFLFHANDNTEYTLLTAHNITGGSYESVFTVDRPLYLQAGDIIKCTAGTASIASMASTVGIGSSCV